MRYSPRAMLVGALFFSESSWAGNSATELVAARELWEEAQQAQARHDWSGCEKALTAALPIVATPGLRFHLAHCREMQGKWVEALVDYKLVEEVIRSGTPAPDVEPLLKPAIARIEARSPKLTLQLREVPEDLELSLDGQLVSRGLVNTRLSLNPGSHAVELRAKGYLPLVRRVTLVESEERTLPVVLVAEADSGAASADIGETSSPTAAHSLEPYVLIAESALTLGAGSAALYYYLDAGAQQSGYARDSSNTKALVWAVSGGVGSAAFFATWLLWPESPLTVEASASRAHFALTQRY